MRIAIERLEVALGDRTAVHGVDMAAEPGEIVGLIGPNGSGKSTFLRAVYRHLVPRAGRVVLDGRDLAGLSRRETAQHLAALPQERGEAFELTARQVVALGRIPYQGAYAADQEEDRAVVAAALEQVGMAGHASRRFSELSGGERQRVLLARALAQQPDVLVLDEPTNHLDIRHQVELLALLRRQRITSIAALHDLNAAASVCDRLYVLRNGRVEASGTPREVLTADLLAEVFGVRAAVVEHPLTGDPLIAFDHRSAARAGGVRADGAVRADGSSE